MKARYLVRSLHFDYFEFIATVGNSGGLRLAWKCNLNVKVIGESFDGPWMVIGDFNSVLTSEDKVGGQPVASSSNRGLSRVINHNGLMGFEGFAFTWNNRRGGMANIQERLDRGFVNDAWRIRFPNATITHLPRIQSNHKPLLLQLKPIRDNLPKPFRFESVYRSSRYLAHHLRGVKQETSL